MTTRSATPSAPARLSDRAVLLGGVLALALLAWACLLRIDGGMAGMAGTTAHPAGMMMPSVAPWQPLDLLLAFAMWSVMMVAMMTPSAAPMLLAHAGLERLRHPSTAPTAATAVFAAGYLLVWVAFSGAAVLLQWALRSAGALSPGLALIGPTASGALLIGVGVYQLTPLKDACLTSCRGPTAFLMSEWRDGVGGALIMGVRHGVYCVGCCWALMLALFAAGIMNLLWVAAIAAYVLAEKALPAGRWTARVAGVVLIGWGTWLLTT